MKCYNCKKEIPNDAQYCPACGSPQQFSQELIDKAINKESAAEDQLYYMTYNNVYWEIKSMVKNEDVIHDLTQDTYIKAYNNLFQLKEAAAFRGWIKRIAHNLTIDYLRKTKPRIFSDMVSSESDEMIDFADERLDHMPEEVMDQQETKRLIDEILNSLPDEQRLAVSMHYYQQKSIREISEELGISENTIKSRLFHGRNKIEVEVRELEKRGTKLYSLAPIPFLLFLFRTVDAQAAELPSEEILQKVKEQYNSGKAGTEELQSETSTEGSSYSDQPTDSSGTGSNITKAAIKELSKKGMTIKIFFGVITVLIIGSVLFGVTHNRNNDGQQNVIEPAQPAGEAEMPETSSGAVTEAAELERAETFEGIYLCEEEKDLYLKVEAIGDYECELTWTNILNTTENFHWTITPDMNLIFSYHGEGAKGDLILTIKKDGDSLIITGNDTYYNSMHFKGAENHYNEKDNSIIQNSRCDGTFIKLDVDEVVYTEPDINEFLGTYTKDDETISLSMEGNELYYSYRSNQGEESGICEDYKIVYGELCLNNKGEYFERFIRNSRENTLTATFIEDQSHTYLLSDGVYKASE